MKAVIEIRQDANGRYYARATGDRVSVREIEIVMDGDDGTHDLWAAAGYDGRRRMAIRRDAGSWLSDGTWRAYDYELVEIAER